MPMMVYLLDGKNTNVVHRCLILGSLFLLIYFNDLPQITDNDTKVVPFADYTSITVTTSNEPGVQTIQPKHSLI